MKKLRILIVGAGIAGLALGRQLIGRHDIDIIEKSDTLHTSGTGIMLGINAIQVLQHMGLAGEIKSRGKELTDFSISDHRGRSLSTLRFSESVRARGLGLYSIHRNTLSEILHRSLVPNIRFGISARRIYEDAYSVYVELSDGTANSYDLVIGADGIYSATRRHLSPQLQLRYAGYTCWRFMIESRPGDRAVEMWGHGRRLGIVPLKGGQTYVFAVANAEANIEALDSLDAVRMQEEFAEFGDIAPGVLERLPRATVRVHNDLYDLPSPMLGSQRILLIGDAAHATTPNMGQGAGMAIEDAWILSQIMEKSDDSGDIITRYNERRLERVSQIVKMSYNLGRIAHWESRPSTWLRNRIFSFIPDSLNARHMENLLLSY